jgi:CBS domain containing-hemolysin-like protein
LVRLPRSPRPPDCALWSGYRFEVIDVDHSKIDQVLVTAQADAARAAEAVPQA